MRTIFKVIALLYFLLFGGAVYAEDFTTCNVVEIVAAGDQNVHVQLSCYVANLPPCAGATNYIGFDATTPAGKHYFALLSMALAMNLRVTGSVDRASCAPQGNVALLQSLRVIQ